MRFEGQTKLFGRIKKIINGIINRIFYILLVLLIIWLIGNIIRYLQGSLSENNLQSVFILKDKPELSIILLVVAIALFWISRNQRWNKILNLLIRFKLLNSITQATILLSAIFYITLFITTRFASSVDSTLLIVASIPILVLIVLILIERARSVEFGGIKIELQQTITSPIAQTVTLENRVVEKNFTDKLHYIIEDIEATREKPNILLVRLGKEMHVEFLALRKYVYELSRVAPIQYIIFTNETERYLGFIGVENFKAKYPKFDIEIVLDDFEIYRYISDFLKEYFYKPIPEDHLKDLIKYLHNKLVLSLWHKERRFSPEMSEYGEITEHDLIRLGVNRIFLLQKSTVSDAYRQIVENKVPGIPVVDEKGKFLGVVDKDKILQEVITKLIENGR